MVNLKQYLNDDSRHKLLFATGEIYGVEFVDVGKELSLAICKHIGNKNVSLITEGELEIIIERNTKNDSDSGDYIAISNIGILFEPELKLNVPSKFENWAKTRCLIVKKEGTIENGTFKLAGTAERKYTIELKGISYKTV